MANTTTVSGSIIQVVPDGTTDWVWSTDLDSGLTAAGAIKLGYIQVIPSATSDRIIVHDVGIDSAPLVDTGAMADAYDTRVIYFNPPRWCRPVLDATDCTFGTAANVRIIMGLA